MMKTKTTKTDLQAAILAGSLLMSSVITSQATTYTWISNSDTDWNNTANWSGGLVPTSLSQAGTTSDSIVFNGTVTPTTNIPTYLSSFQDTIPMTFNSGGSFSLNFSTNFNSSMWANASRTQLTVGDGSTPFTLDINNMTYYARNGVTSTYQVNDGSTLNINGNLTDYPDGDTNKKGVFNLDGGTLNVTGNLNGRLNQTDNNLFINFQTNGGETTASYGGAYADIAAVNADLDTVFTSTNGLVTTDNGDSTFSVYGAGSDNKVTFSGDQTYTGATNTHSGTLVFGGDYKSSLVNIASGAEVELNGAHDYLTTGTSTTFEGAGTLSKTGAGTVQWKNGSATFALDSGSLIDVQAGEMIGGSFDNEIWTDNKSDLNVDAGATFNGFEANIRVDALTGGGSIVSGFDPLAGTSYQNFTFGVDNGSGTFTGTLGNNGTHTGNYAKEGTGTQVLAGDNTYTGTTTVNAGTLVMSGDYKSSLVNIASGAEVELNGAHNYLTSGNSTTFEGAGTLSKTGAGTVQWQNGSATFAMDSGSLIDVREGTMTGGSFGNEVWTDNKSDLNVDAGATFNGYEADVRVDALTGGGAIESGFGDDVNFANSGSVTFGVDNGSGTFTGTLGNNSVNTSWFGSYIKEGTGTQVLAGANTYTGTTTVNGGTLSLASGSSHSGTGAYTVNSGTLEIATGVDLSGHAMTINSGGVISPGNSPGTAATGSQTWNDGGTYLWEINDSGGTKGGNPGWDWLDITGTLDLSNLTTGGFTIDIDSLNSLDLAGTADGFDTYTKGDGIADYTFTIASASLGISSFEESDFVLDFTGFSNAPSWDWSIALSGNDLVLEAYAVPEPSSSALLGLGGLALALRRKRNQ